MKKYIVTLIALAASLANAYRDTETGTFLTRDPLGFSDGPNQYCYVHCNPINSFDPLGLMTSSDARDSAQEDWDSMDDWKDLYEDFDEYWSLNEQSYYSDFAADGYTVYSDDFSQVLMESSAAETRKSAFLVIGNDGLFQRSSSREANRLRDKGYDVNILDVSKGQTGDPASAVKDGLSNIRELDQFSMYFHGAMDINLDYGIGLGSVNGEGGNPGWTSISQLSVGHPTDGLRVHLNGCALPENSSYAQEMAEALNIGPGRVRGAPPGAGVVFPAGIPLPVNPNKNIPFTERSLPVPWQHYSPKNPHLPNTDNIPKSVIPR